MWCDIVNEDYRWRANPRSLSLSESRTLIASTYKEAGAANASRAHPATIKAAEDTWKRNYRAKPHGCWRLLENRKPNEMGVLLLVVGRLPPSERGGVRLHARLATHALAP